jgi:PHD-finger
MIGCDDCDNWFHPSCLAKMGIDIAAIQNIDEFPFSCRDCVKRQKVEIERMAREKAKVKGKLKEKAAREKDD